MIDLAPSLPNPAISSPTSYTHLHVHSKASDGLASAEELVAAAAARGFTALALTDHDTTSGHAAFRAACQEHSLTPILGAELRVRSARGRGHLLVLARSKASYEALVHLVATNSTTRGGAIPLGALAACGPGLVVTSACRGGLVAQAVGRADYFAARDTAEELANAFPGHFYLEVQPTFGALLPWICALGRELGLPVLATNDVHYLDPQDSIRHGAAGLYLATPEQMQSLLPHSAYQHALEVTRELAQDLARATARWSGGEPAAPTADRSREQSGAEAAPAA